MARMVLVLTAIAFGVLVTGGQGREAAAAEGFSPDVSVVVTDDAPSSHPDMTTTIDIPSGELLGGVRTLTPLGGSVASAEEIPDGTTVGEITGFVTIPGPDGVCNQRFDFDAGFNTAPVDPSLFPPYLREAAPGPHIIRFVADVAGTPVNMIFDHVQIEGETRLLTSTYIGDPTVPRSPTCAPYRAQVIINGMAGTTPIITASPIADVPQVHEFTLTSLPDANGHVQEVKRTVALVVQPRLQPRIEGNEIRWNALPDAASYRVVGGVIYDPPCEQVRRLIFREESWRFETTLASSDTSMAFSPPSDLTLERAQVDADVSAYDSDNVLLAHQNVNWARDFRSCWYAPGTEPLLSVEPTSGDCDGEVTLRGSRFPTDVRVEIAVVAYGDYPGNSVGTSAVASDGTFTMTARLPTSACGLASGLREGAFFLVAYNADQPKGESGFASAKYFAAVPQGTAPLVAGPATGTGPSVDGVSWAAFTAFALAFVGAVGAAGGLVLFTRAAHRTRSSP